MEIKYLIAGVIGMLVVLLAVIAMYWPNPVMSIWPIPIGLIGAAISGMAFEKLEKYLKNKRHD